ncbi:unnamed protein product [Clavelina lepadiformis]|uniref:Uncharacterized protein n=1 Tax=Clavelina lepadiformis TaxID=159417 RepID=A0ABP0G0C7_CLALP
MMSRRKDLRPWCVEIELSSSPTNFNGSEAVPWSEDLNGNMLEAAGREMDDVIQTEGNSDVSSSPESDIDFDKFLEESIESIGSNDSNFDKITDFSASNGAFNGNNSCQDEEIPNQSAGRLSVTEYSLEKFPPSPMKPCRKHSRRSSGSSQHPPRKKNKVSFRDPISEKRSFFQDGMPHQLQENISTSSEEYQSYSSEESEEESLSEEYTLQDVFDELDNITYSEELNTENSSDCENDIGPNTSAGNQSADADAQTNAELTEANDSKLEHDRLPDDAYVGVELEEASMATMPKPKVSKRMKKHLSCNQEELENFFMKLRKPVKKRPSLDIVTEITIPDGNDKKDLNKGYLNADKSQGTTPPKKDGCHDLNDTPEDLVALNITKREVTQDVSADVPLSERHLSVKEDTRPRYSESLRQWDVVLDDNFASDDNSEKKIAAFDDGWNEEDYVSKGSLFSTANEENLITSTETKEFGIDHNNSIQSRLDFKHDETKPDLNVDLTNSANTVVTANTAEKDDVKDWEESSTAVNLDTSENNFDFSFSSTYESRIGAIVKDQPIKKSTSKSNFISARQNQTQESHPIRDYILRLFGMCFFCINASPGSYFSQPQ